ncbi:fluoride efflux transporter CrcB [Bacillus marinisedimentorum]|uniref:fluoride efflux transporter CrcB n=1 Tax=Bacillus marinisedimentorum TaxID=1821260 RepID=UPI000871ED7A|nr:fluoride efflux transporter CrcB [Bacillus marinisedimentorum]
MNILAVMTGGFFGALLRLSIGVLLKNVQEKAPVPFAMIAANWAGSFGLGIFMSLYDNSPDGFIFLSVTTGFFGALTTFSTFSNEALQLFRSGKYGSGFLYILLSAGGSILLFWIGLGL